MIDNALTLVLFRANKKKRQRKCEFSTLSFLHAFDELIHWDRARFDKWFNELGGGILFRVFPVANFFHTFQLVLESVFLQFLYPFPLNQLRRTFEKQRKRFAHKLGNTRLLRIHFHTLRHWKATTEYRRTKDILHVMWLLGYKRIENTLKYVQLAEVQGDNEDFICKVGNTMKQAAELIETGFEYVTDQDDLKFFRKRK